MKPTLDEAIAALAEVDGRDLDSPELGSVQVGPYFEQRMFTYRNAPHVIQEAQSFQRLAAALLALRKLPEGL